VAVPIFTDVFDYARKMMDDRDVAGSGLVWPDTELYDFATSSQRDIFLRMCEQGLSEPHGTFTRSIGPSDTKLSFVLPVGQQLPDDFGIPEKLWEKKSGDPDTAYMPMSNTSEILPDEPKTDTLRYWIWGDDPAPKGPAIFFLGSTGTRIVRVLYLKEPPEVTDGSTRLYVPNSYNALALALCARMSISRKKWDTATVYQQIYEDEIERLLSVKNKPELRRNRRRLPWRLAGYYRN
jgi:hypothetical protein